MSAATTGTTESSAAAEAWVAAFAEGWRTPAGADAFADHFDPWLDPDVRLIQPQMPPMVGRRAFREKFVRPLFALVPDLHGTVEGWAADGDVAYIELRLEGTVGRQAFTMRSVDKVTLRDGVAVERLAHFDATPLVGAVARAPSSWRRFIAMQLRGRRASGAAR